MNYITLKECNRTFEEEINNDALYNISMWMYGNPPSTGKREPFDEETAKKLLKRMVKNANDFFNKKDISQIINN